MDAKRPKIQSLQIKLLGGDKGDVRHEIGGGRLE